MPLKIVRSSLESGIEIFTLAGSITLGRESQSFESAVEELIKNRQNRIVLDLKEVSFVDSAGIGILVGCHGKANNSGGELRLAGVGDRVLHVLKITRVDGMMHMDATLDDSIRQFAAAK
ncbi:MAG: STAS domain-containing protein [Acidobacteria bacterium]|nr:STAS domain-containing protein [Acidobacteriota bacterium]